MSGDGTMESWDYSHISFLNFSYTWTINNFPFIPDPQYITSPTFSIETSEKWCLKVHGNRIIEERRRYLSAYLELVSCPKSHISAGFQFSVITAQGEKMLSMRSPGIYKFCPGIKQGFRKFIRYDRLLTHTQLFLPNDSLTLFCKVSVVQRFFSFSDWSLKPGIQVPSCTLADELGKLWGNSRFTDCSVVIAGQEFRVHKAILAARSPVFRAMFEHDMEESRKNRVEIRDLEPQVFRTMMDFIYTEKAPNLHSMADAVLIAADKYGLERLKVMCEDALCRDLSVENAADTLFLADLHSAGQLKTKALKFITTHASEVYETPSWKKIMDSHPNLVAEADSSLASSRDPLLELSLKHLNKSKDPN